jgi:hypothetical protein
LTHVSGYANGGAPFRPTTSENFDQSCIEKIANIHSFGEHPVLIAFMYLGTFLVFFNPFLARKLFFPANTTKKSRQIPRVAQNFNSRWIATILKRQDV